MTLTDRRVLITGASSGIGRAAALEFADRGAVVIGVARSRENLEALAAERPGNVETLAGDLTDPAFARTVAEKAGPVDVLVNAAGRTAHAPFLEAEPEMWDDAWAINVRALLVLTQLVARGMAARRRGHIINISSILARQVYPLTMFYAATKHATAAITRGLRVELAPYGVRVTEIAPGLVDTEFMDRVAHPDVVAAYESRSYERLSAAEVARAIVFAADSDPNTALDLIALNPHEQI